MRNIIILLMASLMTTACGWHLRGMQSANLDIDSIYVAASNQQSPLTRELLRTLKLSDINVTSSPAQAQYIIQLGNESHKRRTVSVGNDSLASQYEVTLKVDYQVSDQQGSLLLPTTEAIVLRTYDFDPNAVIAKEAEERLIVDELRRQLIQQIVRRLQFLHNKAETTENQSTDAQTAP